MDGGLEGENEDHPCVKTRSDVLRAYGVVPRSVPACAPSLVRGKAQKEEVGKNKGRLKRGGLCGHFQRQDSENSLMPANWC